MNCGAVEDALPSEDQAGAGARSVAAAGELVESGFGPGAVLRRRQLEDCAETRCTAGGGRTVKIARFVGNQGVQGIFAVAAAGELVERGLGPGTPTRDRGRKLENCAPISRAALGSRAVQHALLSGDQATRAEPEHGVETVDHSQSPGSVARSRRHFFEDRAVMRSAVEHTFLVKDQRANGIDAVVNAFETVEHIQGPGAALHSGRGQLEDCATAKHAAKEHWAVEIARLAENQGTHGKLAVVTNEVVEHVQGPGTPKGGGRHQLENRAIVRRAAVNCRAIEITRCVEDQASLGKGSVAAACEAVEDGFGPATARGGT